MTRTNRPAETRSVQMGGTLLTWVPDGFVQLHPRGWFPDSTAADWIHQDHLLDDDGCLVASVGSVLLRRDGHAMLVDAGFGPYEHIEIAHPVIGRAEGGQLIASLHGLGVDPSDIDVIAVTHLHTDHIGWAHAHVDGKPVFEQARIVLSADEWSHRAERLLEGVDQDMLDRMAGRIVTVETDEEVWPGVHALATPGHTPGHTSYVIGDGEDRAIVTGDAIHSSIQITHPDWRSSPDTDHDAARANRHRLIAELSRPGTIGVAGHFADVVFGHIVPDPRTGTGTWEHVA